MNKADLVNAVAADTGLAKGDVVKVLDSILEQVQSALKQGDKVTLVGFGTYSVSERGARTGRNPQTGAEINIPAKKVIKFLPGKQLKESVQ